MFKFTDQRGAKASTAVSLSVVSLFSILSAQPAQAIALSQSIGEFFFSNFSRRPVSTDSSVFTSTLTTGQTTGSDTEAIADADAAFETLPKPQAFNNVFSSAITDATGSALAESEAGIIGSFLIGAGETFSFNFSGFVDLLTFTEQPSDFATAALETRYSIFSEGDAPSSEPLELDFFSLFAEVSTPDGVDNVEVLNSQAVTLDQLDILNDTGAAKTAESISVEVSGRYERFFDQPTTLTLAELKLGTAFSQSPDAADVPESSSPWVWLLGIGAAIAFSQRRSPALQPIRIFTR
jgi:hypothetical protein